jgi:hypothetical protein
MIRILGKHGNFNGNECGSALWNSVLRPTAAHGCSVWFPSSAAQNDLLESLQYQAAKITTRTKMNIPKCALLAKLGWEPINAFLDRQIVPLFLRFSIISNNRLSKVVVHELSRFKAQNTEWPYFSYMCRLLEDFNFNINTFNRFFGMNNIIREREIIETKTTLVTYKKFFVSRGTQKYLKNIGDFEISRLKHLARTNYLPLNDVLYRMRLRQNGLCQLCDSNDIETTNHFMFECPAFENLRVDFFSDITDALSCNDLPIDFIGLSSIDKIQLLIGDHGFYFNENIGKMLDIKVRNYLKNLAYTRNQYILNP